MKVVFIDESGFDRHAMCQYGYSRRGKLCRVVTHLQRGKHLSVIAAQIFEGGLNAKCSKTTWKWNYAAVFFLSMESILEV